VRPGLARRRVVWSMSLSLVAVGWLTAHALAYRLVAPHGAQREELLEETGHGYLAAAPALVACAITLLVAGLALAIYAGARGEARAHVAVWPVALVAPLGFGVQEHLERLIELDAFPFGAALEPTFLVGMALQMPFALGAFVLARVLLGFGHALGRELATRRTPRHPAFTVPALVLAWPEPELARPPLLAGGHSERAPPLGGRRLAT
jgi:MFS family permease